MAVAKGEKPNPFVRIRNAFRNMVNEMKKVHWPGKRDLAIYTAVVIAVSLVVSVLIYIMDSGINVFMNFVLSLGR